MEIRFPLQLGTVGDFFWFSIKRIFHKQGTVGQYSTNDPVSFILNLQQVMEVFFIILMTVLPLERDIIILL